MQRRATLLTPFDPSARGNGSSRRAAQWRDALSTRFEVDVVVVPIVSSGPGGRAGAHRTVELPSEAERRAGAVRLMEPRWREWMTATAPLPRLADAAPAWLGRGLRRADALPHVVVAFKMALAPMAADLALAAGGTPLVVDLDDDEASLAPSVSEDQAALERLLHGVARLGDLLDVVLTAAAPLDAARISDRIGRPVRVVPNVVEVEPCAPLRRSGRALFVANFGYRPNHEAADWLRREISPLLDGVTRLDLVGTGSELFGGVGFIDDLEPFYAESAVVLCPVRTGSGTSVKVLEAMAHARPVVTTSVGARGLDVVPGEHLLIADDARGFAAAVDALVDDPVGAAAMGARACDLVRARYSSAVGAASMLTAVGAAVDAAFET